MNKLAKMPGTALQRSDDFLTNIQRWQVMADGLVKTGMLPKEINTAGKALAIMFQAYELGIPPVTALQNTAVINGKPYMPGELLKALVLRDHPDATFKILRWDESVCEIEAWDDRQPKHRFSFSIGDAQKAGLAGKDTYQKWPREMLYSKCLRRVCGVMWPDSLMGIPVDYGGYKDQRVDIGWPPDRDEPLPEIPGVTDVDLDEEPTPAAESDEERVEDAVIAEIAASRDAPAPPKSVPTPITKTPDYISTMARCREMGITDETQKEFIKEQFGLDSRTLLSPAQLAIFQMWVDSFVKEQ